MPSISLLRTFSKVLQEDGFSKAMVSVSRQALLLAIPLSEVVGVVATAYSIYAIIKAREFRKHSAIVDKFASPSREHPRDIMKPHFFQNRQGLWIHHGLWWDNQQKQGPKGIVVMLHGYAEHHLRMCHVAEHFNRCGIAVFMMDHQGFGRSDGDRAHVEDFFHYVDDVQDFLEKIVWDEHPEWQNLPRFIMGHSMGGLVSIHTGLRCQESEHPAHKLAGVMLSAPAIHLDPKSNTWYIRALGRVLDFVAPKAPLISFPSYPSTSFTQVKQHAFYDPLNYMGNVRVHQGLELLRGTELAIQQAEKFKLPLFIIHGVEDLHASIEGSRAFITKVTSDDKTLFEMPDTLHEPLQEEKEIRDKVLYRYSDWALAHL